MGTNSLQSIGNVSPVEAVGDLLDQYYTALNGTQVPRNSSGVPEDNVQDLGSSSYRYKSVHAMDITSSGTRSDTYNSYSRIVVKTSSGTVTAGTPVGYVIATPSIVKHMSASSTTERFLGIATETVATGNPVKVALDYYDLGTTSYSVGDLLFCSDTAGGITKTPITNVTDYTSGGGTKNVTNYIPIGYVYATSTGVTKIMVNGIIVDRTSLTGSFSLDTYDASGVNGLTVRPSDRLIFAIYSGYFDDNSGDESISVYISHDSGNSTHISWTGGGNFDKLLYNQLVITNTTPAKYVVWTIHSFGVNSTSYFEYLFFVDTIKLALMP